MTPGGHLLNALLLMEQSRWWFNSILTGIDGFRVSPMAMVMPFQRGWGEIPSLFRQNLFAPAREVLLLLLWQRNAGSEMRISLILDDKSIEALDKLAQREITTRSDLVREAIADLLARRGTGDLEKGFGLWAHEAMLDGVEYQRAARCDWQTP